VTPCATRTVNQTCSLSSVIYCSVLLYFIRSQTFKSFYGTFKRSEFSE